MLRSVLVATDLSLGGDTALAAGSALAERTGAQLSVISVVELPRSSELNRATEPGIDGSLDRRQDEVRGAVEQDIMEARSKPAIVHVAVGDPADIVTAFGKKMRSSVIVLGAHRLSRFERVLAGSTGERIAQTSEGPVMVATRKGGERFRRILAAIDLSSISPSVLSHAGLLAGGDGATVRVVYAEEPWANLWSWVTLRDRQAVQRRNRERFEEIVRGSPLAETRQAIILPGHAGRAILQEARTWDADLVVLGVRRFRFPSSTRLGWTARYVLHRGDRSILLVPT